MCPHIHCKKRRCIPFSLRHIALTNYLNTKNYLVCPENVLLHVGQLSFEQIKYYKFDVKDMFTFNYYTTLGFLINMSESQSNVRFGDRYKILADGYRDINFLPFCICNIICQEHFKKLRMNGHLEGCEHLK